MLEKALKQQVQAEVGRHRATAKKLYSLQLEHHKLEEQLKVSDAASSAAPSLPFHGDPATRLQNVHVFPPKARAFNPTTITTNAFNVLSPPPSLPSYSFPLFSFSPSPSLSCFSHPFPLSLLCFSLPLPSPFLTPQEKERDLAALQHYSRSSRCGRSSTAGDDSTTSTTANSSRSPSLSARRKSGSRQRSSGASSVATSTSGIASAGDVGISASDSRGSLALDA